MKGNWKQGWRKINASRSFNSILSNNEATKKRYYFCVSMVSADNFVVEKVGFLGIEASLTAKCLLSASSNAEIKKCF